LIEPARLGVVMRTRGLSPSTTLRARIACGASAPGSALGCGTGVVRPFSTRTVCGPAVGKNFSDNRLHPIRTNALSTTASSMLRLSFNDSVLNLEKSWDWVVPLAAPRMTTEDSL
jgi:hypothetical protein